MRLRKKNKTNVLSWLIEPLTTHSATGKPDYTLIITISVLVFFGLLMLSSASSIVSFEETKETTRDSYYIFKQQLTHGVIPGIILFILLVRLPYQWFRKRALLILAVSVIALLLVFIPGLGLRVNSVLAWIKFGPLTVQVSEIAKLAFIMWLALWFASKQSVMTSMSKVTVPFILYSSLIILLLMLQPDMGTMIIFALVGMVLYFIAGASLKHMAVITALGLILLGLLIVVAPYRVERLATFLNPQTDIQGAGYQLNQSLIAIGSGGLTGVGIGQSRQKFNYIPYVTSDSIFAIVGEEWGFIVSTLMIGAFGLIFYRGLQIAQAAPDIFGSLLAMGIILLITVQAVINISAMLGLLPLTGIPLPFISRGGTNIIVLLVSVAILTNISKQGVKTI